MQREIAKDLGIGLSMLRRRLDERRARDLVCAPERQEDRAAELKRLRRENENLRQERENSKRIAMFFAKQAGRRGSVSSMRHRSQFLVPRLCKALGVCPCGHFAWQNRPACHRQRTDMLRLAPVRAAFAVSNGTFGRPRRVHELTDNGWAICARGADRHRELAASPHHDPAAWIDRLQTAATGSVRASLWRLAGCA